MGSFETPKTWVPNMNTKDCSQGFCSLYCPQWCYVIFPPPPPFEFRDENSGPSFSPLVIAIIGILVSAFMLVSYYAIISKLCGNMDSPRRRETHDPNVESEENQDPLNHEPWHVSSNGLDEVLIKSITVCKYTKGDGLVEDTDCSVCLREFQESENLRLLPKCSHAFHVKCIDTWLRSHSNCPLCRANIVQVNTLPLQPPPTVLETPINNENYSQGNSEMDITEADNRDLRNSPDGDSIVEIREVEHQVRRSVSMSNLSQARISVADVICIDQDEEEYEFPDDDVGSSKKPIAEMSKTSHKNRVLQCVASPIAMKRSFSSGRFLFPKCGREQNTVIPF